MNARAFTPYKASKIVNALLEEMGIEKVLPPQMFYNYVKKNFIKTNNEGKIEEEELRRWFEKYVSRLQEKNNNISQLSLFSE